MAFAAGQIVTEDDIRAITNRPVARANRSTTKTGVTGEVGILRLANVSLTSGRLYRIEGKTRGDSSVNTDSWISRIRYVLGGPATTASTILERCEGDDQKTGTVVALFTPTTTGTYSFLMTVARAIGSGTFVFEPDEGGTTVVVYDMGEDPGDTGVDI